MFLSCWFLPPTFSDVGHSIQLSCGKNDWADLIYFIKFKSTQPPICIVAIRFRCLRVRDIIICKFTWVKRQKIKYFWIRCWWPIANSTFFLQPTIFKKKWIWYTITVNLGVVLNLKCFFNFFSSRQRLFIVFNSDKNSCN